jgi:hypothetical protein
MVESWAGYWVDVLDSQQADWTVLLALSTRKSLWGRAEDGLQEELAGPSTPQRAVQCRLLMQTFKRLRLALIDWYAPSIACSSASQLSASSRDKKDLCREPGNREIWA